MEWVDGVVRLDGWINLQMDPNVAAQVVALRTLVEQLVIDGANDPEGVLQPPPPMEQVRLTTRRGFCSPRRPWSR